MASTSSVPLNSEPSQQEERAEHDLPPKSYAEAVIKPEEEQQSLGGAVKPIEDKEGEIVAASQQGLQKEQKTEEREDWHPANGSLVVNGEKERADKDTDLEKHASGNGLVLTTVRPDSIYAAALKHDEETLPRDIHKYKYRQERPKSDLQSGRRAGAGWEKSAIRWAPLNVPLQRRLQTLAVLAHTVSIAGLLTIFFLVAAIPLTWPLLVPYLIYTLLISDEATSGTLKRRSQWLRNSKFWSGFASYFPARLYRTVRLEPTRKYIFGYHPHGIISHGAFAAFATEALGFSELFPGITNTLLTLEANFRVPFYRDYALALGLASVSRESIENLLSKGGLNGDGMGRAVTIVVGGARESLESQPSTLRLVLNARKGFVKIAIRQGADLVPVLAFGENDLYDQVDSDAHPYIHKAQMFVKKALGFTIPLFHARGIFNYDVGLLPYRRPVNIVVGRPIRVVQNRSKDGSVDQKYLDEVHARYVEELKYLWEAHKDTFAKDRDGELEIVE